MKGEAENKKSSMAKKMTVKHEGKDMRFMRHPEPYVKSVRFLGREGK